MSLRVELLDIPERRAGLAALVRSILRLAAVALGGAFLLMLFATGVQFWQRQNHVKTLERTWEMIEDRGVQTDMTIRQLRHMEQTHNELNSWRHSRFDVATIMQTLCVTTPTNIQITQIGMLPLAPDKDAPKPKYPGEQSRQFTLRIDGIVTPPSPNRTVTDLVDALLRNPATSNLLAEARIDNYDANFKTPNDDTDYIFSIFGRTHKRPSP